MANVLKYKTSQPTKRALRKGNIVLGIGDEGYGPTSTTGYVNGISPPDGGYVVYILSSNNDPAIYVANNDNDLITIANTIGGSISTVANAKTYLAGRANTWILDNIPNNIVTDGLVLDLNASNLSSYPESGSNWYDLSGNGNDGTLENGPTFNSNGYITFDGSDDYVQVNGTIVTSEATFIVWLNRNGSQTSYTGIMYSRSSNVSGMSFFGTSNKLSYTWNAASNTFLWDSGLTVPNLGWCMCVIAVSSTSATAYLVQSSGITSSTNNVTHTSTTLDDIKIGRDEFQSRYFNGKIALGQIYNRALSSQEILQNYYGGPIVTDGLVLALDAGNLVSYESGSTTAYSLTGSDSGSLVNGVGYNSNNGGAWSFDGTDDYIGITGVQTPSFSISAWINLSELDRFHGIMGRADSVFTNTSYAFRVINSNKLSISLSNSGTSAAPFFEVSSTATLQSSTWYHVAITFNKPNVTLYINGNIDVTGTFNYDLYNSTSNSIIGGYAYGNGLNYLMKGQIPNLQFYNRALSAEEMLQNYNAQKARFL